MEARKKPPVIIVWEWDWDDGPLATHYLCGDNEIDFGAVWKQIKTLKNHAGRGKLHFIFNPLSRRTTPALIECTPSFIQTFFSAAAKLLDYFADFFLHDSESMRRMWWNLVKHLQKAAVLPHHFWRDDVLCCKHSEDFTDTYEAILVLLNRVILARDPAAKLDLIAHRDLFSPRPSYKVGKFKPGLTHWQQFFLKDSPGFKVAVGERKYVGEPLRIEDKMCERHVPMGALAVVDKHVKRAREIAEEYVQSDPDIQAEEFLQDFDSKSINLHSTTRYISLSGHPTTLQPMHPSRLSQSAPRSYFDGLLDEDLTVARPNLALLDDATGIYMPTSEYEHPQGNGEFRMVTVTTSASKEGEPIEGLTNGLLDDMFDEWA
ncbi:uncharacterized protein EI97DRAFT_179248 [Westerdykella ornata]|uniref:Uncharacterized protein n=1 Tax=Westerdykella ornata TaxID=318751 RepID=A0A6A6JT61_WESOR|nr:uncharacterized protein EI97DRAFT_179248 [Westerdykella ornata]KAF2279547.1 hypothetical protein EI97DRAFT_179248 [Westerdykella ornata]